METIFTIVIGFMILYVLFSETGKARAIRSIVGIVVIGSMFSGVAMIIRRGLFGENNLFNSEKIEFSIFFIVFILLAYLFSVPPEEKKSHKMQINEVEKQTTFVALSETKERINKKESELKKKESGESKTGPDYGCLFIALFYGSLVVLSIICMFNNKEIKPRYKTYYVPSSSGSGRCNYSNDIAIDGSRCGKRASSER